MKGERAKIAPAPVDALNMNADNRIRRILHLSATNFFGGPERQILGHALAADNQRYRIIVAAFSEAGKETELVRLARDAGVPAATIFVRHAYDPGAIRKITKLIDEFNVDVLVSHNYRSNLLGRRAARRKQIRHIAVSRGWTAENLKVRLFHWLDKITLHNSDRVICVSRDKKIELQTTGVPEQRLSIIPNAVTVPDQPPDPTVDWRARYGWEPTAPVIVSAGRLSREKGPDVFVAAIPEILRRCPAARFILFGDGPAKDNVMGLVDRMGLSDTVKLAGHVTELPGELPAFTILVNPSRSEGMPNIILEAMAVRLPVAGTAVGGVSELIVDQKTGRLVPPEDPAALAEAVIEMLENRDQTTRYAETAQQMIRADYSFTVQARQYEEVYERVMADRNE